MVGFVSRVAGGGTFSCQEVAETSLLFVRNFSMRKVRRAAFDDLGEEVERKS